jgi:hypothetical protein
VSKIWWRCSTRDAIIGAPKRLEPTGSFALHPHCGKIRADVDRRIIQNCPYSRGAGVCVSLFGSRLCRLGDYFTSENFKPYSIFFNHQLAANTILGFRGSDDQKRNVFLMLSGIAAAARSEEKKAPKAPPLTLELSYIEDAAHPDVFRIGKGQF